MFLQSSIGNSFEMTSVKQHHELNEKLNNRQSSDYSKHESDAIQLLEQSDEVLMHNYANGNSDAFEELYRRHQSPLYRYCIRQFRNLSIAEECFQEIWMKLVRSRSRYQSTAKFTTYLYRIAQNHVIDIYRKEKKRRLDCEYEDSIIDKDVIAKKNTQSFENSDRELKEIKVQSLRKAIGELPFEQKNTLLLKMDNGLSIDQIAEITGCKKESVKSRLRYATTKLKQLLNSNALCAEEVNRGQ